MPGAAPGEVVEELQEYTSWLVQAWSAHAKAITGVSEPAAQATVARDGVALAVTTVVRAGIAALNSVAILTKLDATTSTLKKPYETDSAEGIRTLALKADLVHQTDPKLTIPMTAVCLDPAELAEKEVEFFISCTVTGYASGPYKGEVEVRRDDAVIQTKTVMLNI